MPPANLAPPPLSLAQALALHRAERWPEAETAYRQLLARAPRQPQVLDYYGQLLAHRQRLPEAVAVLTQAHRLDPAAPGAAIRLAHAHIAGGHAPAAETVLRTTLAVADTAAEVWNALAYVLKVQGRLTAALPCHERALALRPDYAEGWFHHGLTLASLGRTVDALASHERALALDPACSRARFGRAQCLHKLYRLDEAIADYDTFLRAEPGHHEARSYRLFALQNLPRLSPAQLAAEHRLYGRLVETGAPPPAPARDLDPDRRLRVAILSPDLRTHSCAYFLAPLLPALAPAGLELVLYHDHFVEDGVSKSLRQHAAVWRQVVGQPHEALERVIRQDRPDVLIDLSGHIGMTVRLPVFARRPAPVQITYLGYPDTTGLRAMDHRLTDAIADPPGVTDAHHTERLVRFAPTAWCYQPPADAPAVTPPPALAGAPVTFGCFNSPTKFNDAVFAAWGRLLARVPGSRLLLKGRDLEDEAIRRALLARLQHQDVPVDRVELLGRTADTASHLALYHRVDVALDTFPYNGTTTTCEALWMGRAVVALAGDRHAARVGASLLHAVGHPEWLAHDVDDYVRIAAELAAAPARLRAAALTLRADLLASPLLDAPAQGTRFAAAIRQCWRDYVHGRTATPA